MPNEFDENEEVEVEQEEVIQDPREEPEEIVHDPREEQPDEWTPDYSFKVMDKDHEFDDFIKPVVNKENYEQVRDLYEKAYGIDFVKTKKTELENEINGYKEKETVYNQQNQSLGYLGSLIKSKDYHSLFNELKIPDQEIMKYSLDRVNYQDLPPEQKQEYDSNIESKQRLRNLEMQNQQFQSQMQTNAVQARMAELDNHLTSGQMQSAVNEFDQRAGKPGSFREEVLKRGQMAYYSTGKDISVQEAAGEVARLYGFNTETQENEGAGKAQQAPIQQQSVATSRKPTIPNVRSGGHSPARKLPTSIEDLKKAAAAYN